MEFALSEDQAMLADGLRAFLADKGDLDAVREIAGGDVGARGAFEGAIAEMGLDGVLVSEADGGLGLGLLEAALIQEQLGYAVAPASFAETALASWVIAQHGSGATQSEWLSSIANGQARFAAALTQSVSRRDGGGVRASDGKLSGTALFATGASAPTHVLVSDDDGGLHVAAVDDSVSITPMVAIDRTRHAFKLEMKDVEAAPLSGSADGGWLAVARLLMATDTLGASQAMLDKAVEYAKERKQFGRVIGSFQAVKHLCAEMAARLEPSRALIWHGAHLADIGDAEAAIYANLAFSHLTDVGTFIARTSTEVHGGMGFTDLAGLHYWFKRIGVNCQMYGGAAAAREAAARLQGWGATDA